MSLVQDLDKMHKLLSLQTQINDDRQAEISAQSQLYTQLQREYEHKLQGANRVLGKRAERVRTLETRLRNQIYSLSRSQQGQGMLGGHGPGQAGGGGAEAYSDSASGGGGGSVSVEAMDETELAEGENVFEITLREMLLDTNVTGLAGAPPATFLTFDFFEHETQTTGVLSGLRQQLGYAAQFVVKLDAFFIS